MKVEDTIESDSEREQLLESLNASKLALEVRKLRLETTLQFLAAVFVGAFSIGALLMFHYFFRHDFNAGGISAADTISMALTSFSFCAMTTLLLFGMTIAGYPLARAFHAAMNTYFRIRRKRRASRAKAKGVMLVDDVSSPYRLKWKGKHYFERIFGVLLFIILVFFVYSGPPGIFTLFLPVLGAGIFLSIFVFGKKVHVFCPLQNPEPDTGIDKWLATLPTPMRDAVIVAVVTLALLVLGINLLEDLSLTAVGFRKHDVSVRLTKDDFSQFVSQASRSGVVINPCEPIEPDSFVIHHADVLWHRLGTQALIRVPAIPIGATKGLFSTVSIEPGSASISVLHSTGPSLKCQEFQSDLMFDEGSAKLRPAGEVALSRNIPWLSVSSGWKIRVIAYGAVRGIDPRRASPSLRLQQANAVRLHLVTVYGLRPEAVSVFDAGEGSPKFTCNEGTGFVGSSCERMNRRIEVVRYAENTL